jgi:hypothetical protein
MDTRTKLPAVVATHVQWREIASRPKRRRRREIITNGMGIAGKSLLRKGRTDAEVAELLAISESCPPDQADGSRLAVGEIPAVTFHSVPSRLPVKLVGLRGMLSQQTAD